MRKITMLLVCSFGSLLAPAQTKQAAAAMQMQNPATAHAPVSMETRSSGVTVSTQALSGYMTEGFENTAFPSPGWHIENVAGPTYTWARSTAQQHAGLASAFMRYDAVAGGGQDWLILPRFQVAATDSVVFWMRLAFQGFPPDSLCLKISTTDSLLTSFGDHTLLKLAQGTNYPPNATTWYRYAVSLSSYSGQQVILAFKHQNVDGDGLYIDDIAVGTKPANEVATLSATLPVTAGVGIPVTPQATFVNNGSATNSFNVGITISPGGYSAAQTITTLAPSTNGTAAFTPWTPAAPGLYTAKIFTQLAGDANLTNDTLTKMITVVAAFPNGGWSTQTALPGGRWATAPVFAQPCVSGTDSAYMYLISGADASFNNTTLNSAYNIVSGTWRNLAAIPSARTQITPVQVKNKIYVIGGYSGSFAPVTTNSIYDILTDTWTTGAALPSAVGDYDAFSYNDSLIYIIGGYSGSADVNTVQVYNVNTNTWATATPKTGTAVAGARAGISGNKIVHVGGYSQTLAVTIADAVLGTIDPGNPLIITWTSIPAFPAGPTGRHGAGTTPEANGYVYFAAGDPDGEGTSTINAVYAYNTIAGQWEIGPTIPAGVSNISGLAGVIKQDTMYLVSTGGYNGAAIITDNQWLKIGPVTLPAVSANAAICDGGSAVLTAANGTAYSWSPAGTLSNTTIAAPTATPLTTTTYTVDISRQYGCPVPKTVTVTVNPLPTADAGSPATVCAGSSTTLGATGGTIYLWSPAAGLDMTGTATPVATPAATTDYTVTVTDMNGCSNTASVLVNVNPLPMADAGSPGTICQGDSIVLSAAGGISFQWTPGASISDDTLASPTATPTSTTLYTVEVTDANGCVNTDTVSVIVNPLPFTLASHSNISCNGLTDGTAGIFGGPGDYSYLWSTSDTTSSISGLAAGSYSVVLTDNATGCSVSADFTIAEPDALVVTTTNDTTNSCDGEVMASVTGGVFSYSYAWAPGTSISDTASSLCPGTYTVTITDSNGCSATQTAEVFSTVSVSEEAIANFSMYPNPAKEMLSVSGTLSGTTSVVLTDVMGKTVLAIAGNANGNYKTTVDLSSLAPGVYFLQLKNEHATTIKRVVKQ